jgi:hypothetical protein
MFTNIDVIYSCFRPKCGARFSGRAEGVGLRAECGRQPVVDTPDDSLRGAGHAERALRSAGLSVQAAKLLARHGVRSPDELWAMTLTSSASSSGLRSLLAALPGCRPKTATEIEDWWERGPAIGWRKG